MSATGDTVTDVAVGPGWDGTARGPAVPEQAWLARRAAHEARVDAWTTPVLPPARRGEPHPVEDFLSTYYSHRPAQLRRWSPGAGVVLAGPAAAKLSTGRHWVAVDGGATLGTMPRKVADSAAWIVDLLERTA